MDRDSDFESVYREHYSSVNRYVMRRLGHHQESEDLTEEIFLAAYRNFDQYDPKKASILTWLFVITNNKLKNYYRDRKQHLSIDDEENSIELKANDILEEAVLLEEANHLLELALNTLPKQEAMIIRMRYFDNKTSAQIALSMGMSAVNVRVHMSCSINKLKQFFLANHFEMEE